MGNEKHHRSGVCMYRPDAADAMRRAAAWWRGEDIGRPLMQI